MKFLVVMMCQKCGRIYKLLHEGLKCDDCGGVLKETNLILDYHGDNGVHPDQ